MISVFLVASLLIYGCSASVSGTIVKNAETSKDVIFLKSLASLQSNAGRSIKIVESSSDDIIELNVGGEKMTTLRSTLTAIPHSKLAAMFSKENVKKTLPLDNQGAIFFDYNPAYFNYLLDQLRMIKRMPKVSGYQLQFSPPFMSRHVNFTHMLVDLGLTPADFLSPMEGTHVNLTVNSLIGWQECYRSTYERPFDISALATSCNGSRLLVACRSSSDRRMLKLAAIGERDDIFNPCLPKHCTAGGRSTRIRKKFLCLSHHQCVTQAKRGVGWYHVSNQTWGFVRGSLSFVVNPCDSNDLDSDYRLCWRLQSNFKRTSGDRCGSTKNLHGSTKWERIIYHIS